MKKKKNKQYRFNHPEAKGTVTVWRGSYGLEIEVKGPDGTVYPIMIDLFHLAQLGGVSDRLDCMQVCIYNPQDPDGDPLHHVRVWPNGKTQIVGA